jgi:minor extracellular protease Epr
MRAGPTPITPATSRRPAPRRGLCVLLLASVLAAGASAAWAAESAAPGAGPAGARGTGSFTRLAQAVPDDDDDDDAAAAYDDEYDADAGAGADVDVDVDADTGAAGTDDDGGDDDDGDDGDDDDDDGDGDDDDDDSAAAGRGARDDGSVRDRDRSVPGAAGADRRERQEDALDDDEIYDDRGYVARRGQVLALDPRDSTLATARSLGYGVAERYRLESLGLTVIRLSIPEDQDAGEAIRALRGRDPGAIFEYEHLYDFLPSGAGDVERATGESPQPRSPLSTREDLRLGLIDSAIAPGAPAIAGARIQQRPFVSTGDAPTLDHGTAVASILAHRRDGLLPRSQLFVASVFQDSGSGDSIGAATDLARAIDWLISNRTPVINMSLAGPPNAVLEAAVRRAVDRGHIVVAAVGNAGPAARPQYPAAYPGVVGVTAIDARGKVYRRAGRGPHVDFAAPGVAVAAASPRGSDEVVSGTSFAAPVVAAVLALRHVTLDPVAARRAVDTLAREAIDLGDAGQDATYGFGAVPLQAAAR